MTQDLNQSQGVSKLLTQEEVESALEKAEVLRKKKKYQEGIDLLVDALEAGLLKDKIYYRLGNIYYDAEKLDLAEYAYKRVIEFEPSHVNAHYNLSVVYKRKGNIDGSAKMLRKAYLLELKHSRKHREMSLGEKKWARRIAANQAVLTVGILLLIILAIYILLRIIFMINTQPNAFCWPFPLLLTF